MAERSSPIEKENDFSMSFIWTVEATLLLLPKIHTEQRRRGRRRRGEIGQKRRSLGRSRNLFSTRYSGCLCCFSTLFAFRTGSTRHSTAYLIPLYLYRTPPPLLLQILRTYLFMRACKKFAESKILSRFTRNLPTPPPLLLLLHTLIRCVGSFWNFYTHSWLFRLVMFNALGHMCCIPVELLLRGEKNQTKPRKKKKTRESLRQYLASGQYTLRRTPSPEKRIINLSFNKLFCCYKMGKFLHLKAAWHDLYPMRIMKKL